MSQFTFSQLSAVQFRRKAKAPFTGKPYKRPDSTWAGCNRHSRVCADASAPFTGLPRRFDFRRPSGCVFGGMTESIGPMWSKTKTKPWERDLPPPAGRSAPQAKERVGRTTLFSSSAMSSGRLFLDRVGRHQSPSPLHRRDQNKLIARSDGTIYHQTVSSVLTGCLTFRDKCRYSSGLSRECDRYC